MASPITPKDAQSWLDARDSDRRMDRQEAAALMEVMAEDMARTLAADTLEYRIEHQHIDNGMWHPLTQWSPEWPLNEGYSVAPDERIVCRRVSHPWEVTDG